jgi:hypothetical protein
MNSIENFPPTLVSKIEKLLALADPERGATESEAAAASAKIQEILAKYNLELSQLPGKEKEAEIIAYVGGYEEWLGKNDGLWVKVLLNELINLNGGCMVNHSRQGQLKHLDKFTLIGKKHTIEISLFMLDSVVNRVKILEKKAWNSYTGSTKRGQFRRSFFEGAASMVIAKIQGQMYQMRETTPEYGVMILSDREKSLAQLNELFPETKNSRVGGSGSKDAQKMGMRAGSQIDLQRGVGSSTKTSNFLS